MALPTNRPAPAGRRPQDAPSLTGVPPRPAPAPAGAELPDVVAQAVKSKAPKAHGEAKTAPKPSETARKKNEPGQEVAVPEGQTAADVARSITWLGVTYRPPDVWRERQPSLKEEFEYVMAGDHLPSEGPWRQLACVYAAPALGVIAALHVAIWILRSPARHITVWVLVAVAAATAYIV